MASLVNQGAGTDRDARAIAARTLVRVWRDDAYAAAALDAEFQRAGDVDPRDKALGTEFVYGVLRTQRALVERLTALGSKKSLHAEPLELANLLIAAYTLCFLDRIPPFAAVSEAVAAISATSDSRVAGYANAILRKLAASVEGGSRPRLETAIANSVPAWLRGALRKTIGRAGAAAYVTTRTAPPIGLCLARGQDRATWLARMKAALPEASFEGGTVSPRAILVRGAGDVRRLPGHDDAWIVQEEGAQCIALAVGARPGESVLDACAGRGNKTWTLADEVTPAGAVDAADVHASKLRESAHPRHRAAYVVDWSSGTGDVPPDYDRVLVDAPCSGIGTLRRRPEIGLRRDPSDIQRLAELQIAITQNAASRVRTGGRLVYAVCSVLAQEAEEVVLRLTTPGALTLEPAPFDSGVGRAIAGDTPTFRLLPHLHDTDGYFVASFIVRR